MPYQLAQYESVEKGLRRIVREEIDSAVARLRRAGSRSEDPDSRGECIHEARKSIKKLRGIVRLLTPEMGAAAKRDNISLRDAGRLLSVFRDDVAILETVDDLGEKYADDPAAVELVSLRAVLVRRKDESEKRNDMAGASRKAIGRLLRFGRRVNTWPEGEDGFSLLAPGLRVTYRRGRRALARAVKKDTATDYHEFRKRVKDHWYHIRLLEGLSTPAGEKSSSLREKDLKDMQEWLGEDHNLVLLEEIIADDPTALPDAAACARVLSLVGKYRSALREKAVSHGRHLYKAKPKEFMRGLRDLWDGCHPPRKSTRA